MGVYSHGLQLCSYVLHICVTFITRKPSNCAHKAFGGMHRTKMGGTYYTEICLFNHPTCVYFIWLQMSIDVT